MSYIFVHGLGQRENSWEQVINNLNISDEASSIDLTKLVINEEMNYENLYRSFCELCDKSNGGVNLCGISLGAILCLNYAIDNPKKVATLTLVAPQYKIPKAIFRLQNLIFRIMPKSIFNQMGFSKRDTLSLTKSMINLDFTERLDSVKSTTLILCGSKDSHNLKASRELNRLILNSKFQVIQNAKHEVNIENPKELSSKLQSFYREQ